MLDIRTTNFLVSRSPVFHKFGNNTNNFRMGALPTFSLPFHNATEVCMAIQGYAFTSIKIVPFGHHFYITAALYSIDKKKWIP